MRRDELLCGARIFMLFVPLGEHELLVGLQHRKLPDFLEVTGEATLGGEDGEIGLGHLSTPFRDFPRVSRGGIALGVRYGTPVDVRYI
jgi:hypothetical protein